MRRYVPTTGSAPGCLAVFNKGPLDGMSFGTAAGVMRPRACGRAFWHLFILAVCVYSTVSAARAHLRSSAAVRSCRVLH